MHQHPQFVRISEETVVNVQKIDRFDETKLTVFLTAKDGTVSHQVEDAFWDEFIAAYRLHRN
ncbi:hypothetical protein D3C74_43570 [compost metagenome]